MFFIALRASWGWRALDVGHSLKKLDSEVSIENKNASEVAWTRQSTLFTRILPNYNPNPSVPCVFCYAVPFVRSRLGCSLNVCLYRESNCNTPASPVYLNHHVKALFGWCSRSNVDVLDCVVFLDRQQPPVPQLGCCYIVICTRPSRVFGSLIHPTSSSPPGHLWLT